MFKLFHHHNKKNKQTVPTVEIGSRNFNNMIFCLKRGINKDNIYYFDFNGFRLFRYGSNIYMMVVYVQGHSGNIILMIVSPILQSHKWAVSFCRAQWNKDHEVIRIDPLHSSRSTGGGLNAISKYSPSTANRLMNLFKFLNISSRGQWRCIKG